MVLLGQPVNVVSPAYSSLSCPGGLRQVGRAQDTSLGRYKNQMPKPPHLLPLDVVGDPVERSFLDYKLFVICD